jgi:hypothetical protein
MTMKLEAKWAALFDHLALEYSYEAKRYVCEDGSTYLPDFHVRLSDAQFHVISIKPTVGAWPGLSRERQLLQRLSRRQDVARASMLAGEPGQEKVICVFEDGVLVRPWELPAQSIWPVREPIDPSAVPPSWYGPFPWSLVTKAWKAAGKTGVLLFLQLWSAAKAVDFAVLPDEAADIEGIDRTDRNRALRDMADASIITLHRRARRAKPTIELSRPGRGIRSIRGPLPIAWIRRAAALGRNPLLVGLAIWRQVGVEGNSTVAFDKGWLVPEFMSMEAKTAAQGKLAKAGLIAVKPRRGHASLVTILVDGALEEPGEANETDEAGSFRAPSCL